MQRGCRTADEAKDNDKGVGQDARPTGHKGHCQAGKPDLRDNKWMAEKPAELREYVGQSQVCSATPDIPSAGPSERRRTRAGSPSHATILGKAELSEWVADARIFEMTDVRFEELSGL